MCTFKSNKEQRLELFVVNNAKCIPILGLDICVKLKLINRVNICQVNPHKSSLELEVEKKFKNIFRGIGNFKQNYNLELKSDGKPVTHAPRKFAILFLGQLKIELSILEKAQPKYRKYIERFLGMYSYVSKFIPHTSDKTKPLRLS